MANKHMRIFFKRCLTLEVPETYSNSNLFKEVALKRMSVFVSRDIGLNVDSAKTEWASINNEFIFGNKFFPPTVILVKHKRPRARHVILDGWSIPFAAAGTANWDDTFH